VVRDGLLYEVQGAGETSWRLCVPASARRDYLQMLHASAWAGHWGVKKTVQRAKACVSWKGMVNDIVTFIKNCDLCQE
jgi:hypothetical protein